MEGREIETRIVESFKNLNFKDLLNLLQINKCKNTRSCIISAMEKYYKKEFKRYMKGGDAIEKEYSNKRRF